MVGWLPRVIGGDRGARTPDLSIANAALSQLSYAPILNAIFYRKSSQILIFLFLFFGFNRILLKNPGNFSR